MKFGLKSYFGSTPKFLKKLGDALLASSTAITTYGIADGNKTLALTALFAGVGGKFLTNLFEETPATNVVEQQEQ